MKHPSGVRHYFVDEAGDTTLFNKRGAVIVGREGVSKCFMVGVAWLPDPARAHVELEGLRARLLADPYFAGVPSMRLDEGKTALCFHAKDDLPEVRREVFGVLKRLGVQVQAAIRRKESLVSEARAARRLGQRLTAHAVYDDLIKRLFKNLLHQGETNTIVFARRGKSDRQAALRDAIERAKRNFRKAWATDADQPTAIAASVPSQSVGLQVVDYYLWALQRMFETGEDRFFNLLAQDYRLVMDLDDKRCKPYGRWYSRSDPLTSEKIKPLTS